MNYAEIAVLAKSISTDYFNNNNYPIIKVLSSNTSDKSIVGYINQLHDSGLNIEVFKLDYQQRFINGRLQRYIDNRVLVCVSDKLNTCWSRYVVTKELTHLIIDKNNESFTTNVDMLVNWIIDGLNVTIDKPIESEHVAAHLAAEILIPYSSSQELLKNSAISTYDIALRYSVPKKIVELFRIPEYIERRDKAYSDI